MTSKSVCLIVTAEVTATTFYRGYLDFLTRSGWRVFLIASSDGKLIDFARSEGAIARDVPMRRDPSPINDLLSLIRLYREIRHIRPAAVVTATPKAGLLGTFAAFLAGVPVRVYQLWGIRFETESGLKRSILKLLESRSIRFSTQVVANSKSLARRSLELGLLGGKPIVVLGPGSSHGVDLQRFSIDAEMAVVDAATAEFLEQGTDDLLIGFVGRVHQDKGIHTLLRALEICAAQGLNVRLLVVGAFESDDVVSQIRQSAIEAHLTGAVSDTRPYLKEIDIHCLPTRREGFPNVVLEAGAMGLVTIASDATGAIDSVIDEETGLLFATDDPESLAQAITRLALDGDLRARLGTQAREHIEANFSRETIWALQEANLSDQTRGMVAP